MATISRTQFLRGDVAGRRAPIRPPWALAEAVFTERCDACGECLRACPAKILVRGRAAYPQVDFALGACLFCGDCARACRQEAFADEGTQAWQLTAAIGASCLSFQGVECRSCGDHCEPQAIQFRPRVAATALPTLDAEQCNGCGACIAVCPAGAMSMQAQHQTAGVEAS